MISLIPQILTADQPLLGIVAIPGVTQSIIAIKNAGSASNPMRVNGRFIRIIASSPLEGLGSNINQVVSSIPNNASGSYTVLGGGGIRCGSYPMRVQINGGVRVIHGPEWIDTGVDSSLLIFISNAEADAIVGAAGSANMIYTANPIVGLSYQYILQVSSSEPPPPGAYMPSPIRSPGQAIQSLTSFYPSYSLADYLLPRSFSRTTVLISNTGKDTIFVTPWYDPDVISNPETANNGPGNSIPGQPVLSGAAYLDECGWGVSHWILGSSSQSTATCTETAG